MVRYLMGYPLLWLAVKKLALTASGVVEPFPLFLWLVLLIVCEALSRAFSKQVLETGPQGSDESTQGIAALFSGLQQELRRLP